MENGRRRRLYSGYLEDHPPSRDSRVNSHTSRGIPSHVRDPLRNSSEVPAIDNESVPQRAIGTTSRLPLLNF